MIIQLQKTNKNYFQLTTMLIQFIRKKKHFFIDGMSINISCLKNVVNIKKRKHTVFLSNIQVINFNSKKKLR